MPAVRLSPRIVILNVEASLAVVSPEALEPDAPAGGAAGSGVEACASDSLRDVTDTCGEQADNDISSTRAAERDQFSIFCFSRSPRSAPLCPLPSTVRSALYLVHAARHLQRRRIGA